MYVMTNKHECQKAATSILRAKTAGDKGCVDTRDRQQTGVEGADLENWNPVHPYFLTDCFFLLIDFFVLLIDCFVL